MALDGNEFKEELNKTRNLNPYEKLGYIRKLAEFHLQFLDMADYEYIRCFLKDLLDITKGYHYE